MFSHVIIIVFAFSIIVLIIKLIITVRWYSALTLIGGVSRGGYKTSLHCHLICVWSNCPFAVMHVLDPADPDG